MLVAMLAACPCLADGGFDGAIDVARSRVVKLYGLGAGAEVGYGSGIIVSGDGKVLTVLSLLIDAHRITAIVADGTAYRATVIARDPNRQLALLQLTLLEQSAMDSLGVDVTRGNEMPVPHVQAFDHFTLDDRQVENPSHKQAGSRCYRDIAPGDWVIGAGNPFRIAQGAEPVSITHGVFQVRTDMDATRRFRDFPYHGDVLVIDGIVNNPGFAGGALVDLDGCLVGMIGRAVRLRSTHTALNYAIPREVLRAFMDEALSKPAGEKIVDKQIENPSHKPIDLGIRMAKVGYRKVLPFVERVVADSPAGRAGVQADDLILAVNGRNVSDVKTFLHVVASLRAVQGVELVVRRGRTIKTMRIEGNSE